MAVLYLATLITKTFVRMSALQVYTRGGRVCDWHHCREIW